MLPNNKQQWLCYRIKTLLACFSRHSLNGGSFSPNFCQGASIQLLCQETGTNIYNDVFHLRNTEESKRNFNAYDIAAHFWVHLVKNEGASSSARKRNSPEDAEEHFLAEYESHTSLREWRIYVTLRRNTVYDAFFGSSASHHSFLITFMLIWQITRKHSFWPHHEQYFASIRFGIVPLLPLIYLCHLLAFYITVESKHIFMCESLT